MRRRPSPRLLAVIAVGPTAFFLVLVFAIQSWVRIPPPSRASESERVEIASRLRAGLEGEPAQTLTASGPVRVVAVVWAFGIEVGRAAGRGRSTDAALADAAAQLSRLELTAAEVNASRISVHLVSGDAPLASEVPGLGLFALHPGVDGVRATAAGREALLLPLDLHRHNLLSAKAPLSFIPDLKLGLDIAGIEMLAATRLGLSPSAYRQAKVGLRRFRTDAFVEPPTDQRDRPPIALVRNIPPRPPLSARALRAAALSGGRFLVAHLAPSGRYIYEVDVGTGRGTDPKVPLPYSLPRHAGTTYYLAELYRLTGEHFLAEPIERAFAHLAELARDGKCSGTLASGESYLCVVDKGQTAAALGSSALAVVALAEYRRATGKQTYDQLTREMLAWILDMQRPDGSFTHIYDVVRGEKDDSVQNLYFSGEATLALARAYEVFGEKRYLDAAVAGIDNLIDWYDFFAGGLFYGEEHWTCIAAEALWPHARDDRYRTFCDGYGEFLRLIQPGPSDFSDSGDLAGTYAFTPFVVPANTPAGSRTEAMISAYLLGDYHGKPNRALRQQILAGAHFGLGQQITADGAFWMPRIGRPIGGIPASPIDPSVRIDYVQHVGSALLRTAALLDRSESRDRQEVLGSKK